ncbi:MAG: 2-oxoglutarate and iron-dependent oxygenase domain-containing protein, partial [Sphingomonadaceae bacterium]
MTDVLNQIPTLSLADQARDPDGFAQAIGNSFRTFGFAVVADHGIDAGLIDRAWDLTRQFFALPEEVKRSYYSA